MAPKKKEKKAKGEEEEDKKIKGGSLKAKRDAKRKAQKEKLDQAAKNKELERRQLFLWDARALFWYFSHEKIRSFHCGDFSICQTQVSQNEGA